MIDWSRAIKEKTYIGKTFIERVVYRDETENCQHCIHLIKENNGSYKCDIFPNKKWSTYHKACVQYESSNN